MRAALFSFALWWPWVSALGTPPCARVLEHAGESWALVRLPSRLNVVSHYQKDDGRLVLVDQSFRNPNELKMFEWDLSRGGDRSFAALSSLRWNGDIDGQYFRPTVVSPDGRMAATLLSPHGARVALHAPDEFPDVTYAVNFGLGNVGRTTSALDFWNADEPSASREATADLPQLNALHLSFSPDGTRLLGHTPLGVEVHDVATRRRRFAAYSIEGAGTTFAGWLDNETCVEVSENGAVTVRDRKGQIVRTGAFPTPPSRGTVDATTFDMLGRRWLLYYSTRRPLALDVYDPVTLQRHRSVALTGLSEGTDLEWMSLTQGGIALFHLATPDGPRLGAIHVPSALAAGLEELRWRDER